MDLTKRLRQTWEYKQTWEVGNNLERLCNSLGEHGWELAAMTEGADGWFTLIFKRPL